MIKQTPPTGYIILQIAEREENELEVSLQKIGMPESAGALATAAYDALFRFIEELITRCSTDEAPPAAEPATPPAGAADAAPAEPATPAT